MRRNKEIAGQSRARTAAVSVSLAAVLLLGACAGQVENHGNMADQDKVAQIKPGVHTRQQVARLLGSPSSVAALNGGAWYYIGKRQERWAFFKPTVKDQRIVIVHFTKSGVVREVKRYGLKDARRVSLVARTTPTRSSEPGLLKALYGTLLRGPLQTLGGVRTNDGFIR